MSYKPLRRDLTNGKEICFFCRKPLSSLKAYVLECVDIKATVLSGKFCANKNIASVYSLKSIPDLTKYTSEMSNKEMGKRRKSGLRGSTTSMDEEHNMKRAIEYLELRECKLTESFNTSYDILRNYYFTYKDGRKLEDDALRHILNIENKAPESLKLNNLHRCYNYYFWINVGIERLGADADKYLVSVRDYLIRNLEITEKQKVAVNKWLEHLEGVPQLI